MITGQVKGIAMDDHGNLKVETEYTLTDGEKTTGYTRYNCLNFSKAKVLQDVKAQCENLMMKIYNLKQNQELARAVVTDVAYECSSFEFVIKPEIKDGLGNIVQAKESIIVDDK